MSSTFFLFFFASAHIWKFRNNSHFFFLLLFCLIFGEYKFISVLTWIIEIYYSHFVFVSETLRKSPRIIESQIHDTGEMAMEEWGVHKECYRKATHTISLYRKSHKIGNSYTMKWAFWGIFSIYSQPNFASINL